MRFIHIEWAESQKWFEKVDNENIFAGDNNDVFVNEELLKDKGNLRERKYEIHDKERNIKSKEVILERGKKKNKKFGKITKITFPDESKIYISKQGWTLVAPEKHFKKNMKTAKKWGKIELLIPFSEINVAIQESIIAGYTLSNSSPPVRTSECLI